MRRTDEPQPDLFDDFAHRVEDVDDGGRMPGAGTVVRSAGVTLALMLLTSLGAIGGAWVASGRTPDVEYTTVLWEGVVLVVWCALWGALSGGAALALGVVAVALPWVRRQRAREAAAGQPSAGASAVGPLEPSREPAFESSGALETSTSEP